MLQSHERQSLFVNVLENEAEAREYAYERKDAKRVSAAHNA